VRQHGGGVDSVLIYDLGMTAGDRRRFAGIRGVEIRPVGPFCAHWRQCWTWKPWVWAHAATSARRVLYMDAGVEIVGDLGPILAHLDERGYFALDEYPVHPDGHTIGQITPTSYFAELSIDRALVSRPVISAGIVGFDAGSRFHQNVVPWCLELNRSGYNLGWSVSEVERNNGIHRLDPCPTYDCELFRHDQTVLGLVFHTEFAQPVIQSRELFPWDRPPRPGDVLWQHRGHPPLRWLEQIDRRRQRWWRR
jgi:hypothetical protein